MTFSFDQEQDNFRTLNTASNNNNLFESNFFNQTDDNVMRGASTIVAQSFHHQYSAHPHTHFDYDYIEYEQQQQIPLVKPFYYDISYSITTLKNASNDASCVYKLIHTLLEAMNIQHNVDDNMYKITGIVGPCTFSVNLYDFNTSHMLIEFRRVDGCNLFFTQVYKQFITILEQHIQVTKLASNIPLACDDDDDFDYEL